MLENRPIVIVTLGYIIGIIMGLYCKISIVFLYILLFIIDLIINNKKQHKYKFKLISFRRYFRYFKMIFTSKVLKIMIISSILSNSIILYQNNKYENLYKELENQEILITAKIVSNKKENNYKDVYKIKIENINGQNKYKNTYVYLNIRKDKNIKLKYEEKITIKGIFRKPQNKRNYKGFDYKQYLKTLKVYGTVDLINIDNRIETTKSLSRIFNDIFLKIKEIFYENFEEETANILLGLTIGYTDNIDEEIKDDFSDSNISHILAISGMHVAYITICIKYVFDRIIGVKWGRILATYVLIIYMFITGFSPSVVRASIMGIISLLATVFYKKNDTWNNLCVSLLILLIYNPFLIQSTSVLLSFAGTIGILVLHNNIKSITLSATIFIIPIMSVCFNTISIISLIISVIVGWIVAPIIILGFSFVFICKVLEIMNLKSAYTIILELMIKILISISKIGSNISLNKVYVTTPNLLEVIIYYILVLIR